MWKPAAALRVSREDQEWLETLVRSGQTPQRVALRARIGEAAAGESGDGASDLASAQSPAPSRRDVQAQPRSRLRAQAAGHRRPLPEPAGESPGAERR